MCVRARSVNLGKISLSRISHLAQNCEIHYGWITAPPRNRVNDLRCTRANDRHLVSTPVTRSEGGEKMNAKEEKQWSCVVAINITRSPMGNTRHVHIGLFENYRDGATRSRWFGSRRLQPLVKISLATSYIGTCRLPAKSVSTKFRIPAGNGESRAWNCNVRDSPRNATYRNNSISYRFSGLANYYFPVDRSIVRALPFVNFYQHYLHLVEKTYICRYTQKCMYEYFISYVYQIPEQIFYKCDT